MFTRLHRPGGALGGLSVAAFLILAIFGVLGLASMPIALATDSDAWSSGDDRIVGFVVFGLMIAGAIGFLIMDRRPGLGATLGILGCLALAFPLFWLIVPIIVGIGFAVVAFVRASWFSEHKHTAHAAPA